MYRLTKKFFSKRAFITGAASGLGRALSLELAKEGWTIGLADIDSERLSAAAAMVKTAGGIALPYTLDTASKQAYKNVSDSFLTETGGIDLLINNAGVACGATFEEIPLEDWEWIVNINLMGVVNGCHYFIPVMKKQQSGHIINISSAASFVSPPRLSPYNATKAAVTSLSESLRVELHAYNIGVSAVMPTFFKTNIMHSSRTAADEREVGNYMIETSGLEAEEVAKAVLRRAGKNQLYIVLPLFARFLFVVKRIFPTILLKMVIAMSKNNEKIRQRLKKRYVKMKQKALKTE